MMGLTKPATLFGVLLCGGLALASVTPEQKCQAAKNLAAGKYAACLQNAEKGQALVADAVKYDAAIAKCAASLAKSWQIAIDKAALAGATCPDAPLVADDYKAAIDTLSHKVATALAGGGLPPPDTCGNGTVEPGENCDFGTVGGQTCASASGATKPFGKLGCKAGCVFDMSGCFPCPGVTVLGACWSVGARGESCTSVCTRVGLVYDPATASIAGSGGSDANCLAVGQAIYPFWTSPPYPNPLVVQGAAGAGFGCGMFNLPTLLRDGNPTIGDATDSQVSRFCACH